MEWAFEEGHPDSAVHFAEAAAYAHPLKAACANIAGRACRMASMHQRAEGWFERGVAVSVRTQDRQGIVDALLGYGSLKRDLGEHDEARPYFERAARRALNTGRNRQAAKAHHDLLTIAAEVGTLRQGRRHVRVALDNYPAADPQLPALAHDWAYLLVRLGHYSAAIPLLNRARDHARTPAEESIVCSTLAWALGGIRNRQLFDAAATDVTALLEVHHAFAPAALLHLARGAHAFGQWDQAESFAGQALARAHDAGESANEQAARELLAQLQSRQLAAVEQEPPDSEDIARIARRFESRLRSLPAPGRERRRAIDRRPAASAGA